ncbi:MAG: endonuclease/exonuclease/phosphatase family protein [Planctomycetota bacterium]|jgi:endonuclease/exonuclease/phosphatase family metal-dependent hydrolase
MPNTLLFCLLSLTTPSSIVIDGRFDDWAQVPVQLTDPADAPEAAVDFGELRVTHDDRFVHLLADFGNVVNLHHLRGTARLLLDADGDARTGQTLGGLNGVDVAVELTPPNPDAPGRFGRGVGLRVIGTAQQPSAYDIGFTFGPTYANRRFEMRLDRRTVLGGAPPFLAGGRFSGRLEFTDARGQVHDRTDPFTYELSPVDPMTADQLSDPLSRPPRADLRIVNWNVEFGGLFQRPERFGRTLRALDPDVILLQEVNEDTTAPQLVEFLQRWVPGQGRARGEWSVLIGAGGGDLRTVVAARHALESVAPLRVVPMPDRPDRTLRIAAAVVGTRRRLLVLSVHLRCCGWAGGFEDRTRQVEAGAIRRAVQRARTEVSFDGVVIAGDLNLVGSRRPLELLAEDLDSDGSALAVAAPLQIDGLSNVTWSDPGQPFTPGRLDFLLYADRDVEAANAFVMDVHDMAPPWRDRHRLRPDDTASASDHFPLVVDLRWIDRER